MRPKTLSENDPTYLCGTLIHARELARFCGDPSILADLELKLPEEFDGTIGNVDELPLDAVINTMQALEESLPTVR